MTYTLLKCLGRAALRNVIPGGCIFVDLADEVMDRWREAKREEERREELEQLAALTAEQTRAAVAEVIAQVAADQSVEKQQALAEYLQRVPGSIRASLERPEDPAGTSLPPEQDLDDADDLRPFIPQGTPSDDDDEDGELSFDATATETPPQVPALLQVLPGGATRTWQLTRPYYSVGRDGAKISLDDPTVSRRHIAIAQLGNVWVAINLKADKRMRVNGWELRQRTLCDGDTIRIGNTHLVFRSTPSTDKPKRLRPWATGRLAGQAGEKSSHRIGTLGSIDEPDVGTHCTLRMGGHLLATSDGNPILIGRDGVCSLHLDVPGIAALHTLLAWTPEGLQLIDLGSGFGTLVDGHPVKVATLQNNQTIRIGDAELTLTLTGDPTAPAREIQERLRSVPRRVALTAIYGAHRRETTLLPAGEAVTLGRSESVDLALPRDQRVAEEQARLRVDLTGADRPIIHVRGLSDDVATLINRETGLGSMTASVGDVLQFGGSDRIAGTALLLHYPLTLDRWPDLAES